MTYISDEGDAKFVKDQYDLKLAEDKVKPITRRYEDNAVASEAGSSSSDTEEVVKQPDGMITADREGL